MKRLFIFFVLLSISIVSAAGINPATVSALSGSQFDAGRIMDDSIFYNGDALDTNGVQAFLNSKVPTCDTNHAGRDGNNPPFTCLKDFRQDTPSKSGEAGLCNNYGGGNKSAAQIIRDVGHDCGISQKVLIVLLEKEQSLITDTWPWAIQYRSATGYGCPDTAPCDAEYYGFFNQVYNAARQFKKYGRDANLFSYKAFRGNYIQYNPNAGCGGTTVYIQNQATAALYNYTPYQPNPSALNNLYGSGDGCGAYGNRNFWRLYNDWFGPTQGYYCDFLPPRPVKYGVQFGKISGWTRVETPIMQIFDGTGTNCVEFNAWNPMYGSWGYNVASNQRIIDPGSSIIRYGDIDGNGVDEPILIGLNGTGSGKIEFHVWDASLKTWRLHIASNQTWVDPRDADIQFGDMDGDGRDKPVLIGVTGTGSGKVEFHTWNTWMNVWEGHTASNQPNIDPRYSDIQFADIHGIGRDQAMLMGLKYTGSGKIEFHTWRTWMNEWESHIASNQPVLQ